MDSGTTRPAMPASHLTGLHAIPGEKSMFDAPRKEQQVWFVRRLGADVNLGNITPEEVLSLETIRVGLRSDTAVADLHE